MSKDTMREMLRGLTTTELRSWAGSKIYDRGKGYLKRVQKLGYTEEGYLIAGVQGRDDYVCYVRRNGESDFDFSCTCPYGAWDPCKHVIAVLLEAVERLNRQEEIPRLAMEDFTAWNDAYEEDDELAYEEESHETIHRRIDSILREKSREELVAIITELALKLPEVYQRIKEASLLEHGEVDTLVKSLRVEIDRLSSMEVWYDHWNDEGDLPDYSHLEEQLRSLLNKGYADEVLELGLDLWKKGNEQIGQSHNWETASAISGCMDIVLEALPHTSRTPVEQMIWYIDRELEDEYDLLERREKVLMSGTYNAEHWREVASILEERLGKSQPASEQTFDARYQRENIGRWICTAYRMSWQEEKVIPFLEREVDYCLNYDTLVTALIDAGEVERARKWCVHGFQQTAGEYPGIASTLKRRLRELAEKEGNLPLVAAYSAKDFFESPSEETYSDLRSSVERMGVWEEVRKGLLNYLRTGIRPDEDENGKVEWPLPSPEVKRERRIPGYGRTSFPKNELLIRIALLEGRNEDAVEMYSAYGDKRISSGGIDEKVAHSVQESHPDLSLKIWEEIAQSLIALVKPKHYYEAAGYLKNIRALLYRDERQKEWEALIAKLRAEHKPKRRLMEILDDLTGGKKIDGMK